MRFNLFLVDEFFRSADIFDLELDVLSMDSLGLTFST
jgi:hypothetical protein